MLAGLYALRTFGRIFKFKVVRRAIIMSGLHKFHPNCSSDITSNPFVFGRKIDQTWITLNDSANGSVCAWQTFFYRPHGQICYIRGSVQSCICVLRQNLNFLLEEDKERKRWKQNELCFPLFHNGTQSFLTYSVDTFSSNIRMLQATQLTLCIAHSSTRNNKYP